MDTAGLANLLPWTTMGLNGIVALVVLLVLTGKLVPRSTVEEMRKERDARLTDLMAAHRAEVEARKLTSSQVSELVDNSRATLQVLQALRGHADEEPK